MKIRLVASGIIVAVAFAYCETSEATLTGQYLFEEGSGLTALDSSGFARNGTLTDGAGTGAPTWTAGLYLGSISALSFEKNDKDRVALPIDTDFIRNAPGATLMAWIQIEERLPVIEPPENFFTTIVQVNNSTTPVASGGARAAISNSFNQGFRSIGSVASEARNGLNSFVFPEIGTPFFAVGVFDYVNGTNTMFVNGVQVAQNIVPAWAGNSADTVNAFASIGASPNPAAATTLAFHGAIDGVRIFNTALTAQEILDTYNAELLPPTAIPGDFDLDTVVDGEDLIKWQGDFGPTAASDADADGDSDGADFLIWQQNLGMGGGGASAVPEPNSASLLLILAAVFAACRFRAVALAVAVR